MAKTRDQLIRDLSRMTPAASNAQLGQLISDMLRTINALTADNATLRTKIGALLTKMDGDSGIAGTDYATTLAPPGATAAPLPDIGGR